MASMPWFRVYSEILDDKKIKRIVRTTGYSKALIIGTWICLLALANNADERGRLTISEDMPYKLDDLEDETGLEREVLMAILDQFVKMGMVVTGGIDQAYEINKWNKRQFKSDNSTERVREFREKQDETLQKRYKGVIDTESDTDTDSEYITTTSPNAYKIYQDEIGMITVSIKERLDMAIDDYTDDWVTDAIKVASGANVRNLKYIEAILSRWKREGKGSVKKQYQGKPAPESLEDNTQKVIKELLDERHKKGN